MVWYSRKSYRSWADARLWFYFFLVVTSLSLGALTGSLGAHLLRPEGVNFLAVSIVGWIALLLALISGAACVRSVYTMNAIMEDDQAKTLKALS